MEKSYAETFKNEENAKFYAPLCLGTLFCGEFMGFVKIRKYVKTNHSKKKSSKTTPPALAFQVGEQRAPVQIDYFFL